MEFTFEVWSGKSKSDDMHVQLKATRSIKMGKLRLAQQGIGLSGVEVYGLIYNWDKLKVENDSRQDCSLML